MKPFSVSLTRPFPGATLHKELSDVVQCHLENRPVNEQRQQMIEAVAVLQHRLDEMNAAN